ncbi:MAG: tyrosinase family protein [Saprospiraceae bacterium]
MFQFVSARLFKACLLIAFCCATAVMMAQNCEVLLRRNINSFTQTEMDEFTSAILAMKNRPSLFDAAINAYDYFVVLHMDASLEHTSAAHHSPGFNPWHREFLLRFEQELRVSTNNPKYTLPYWDWTDNASFTKIFNANAFGGNGAPMDSFIVQNGRFGKTANQFRINYFPISIPDTAYSPHIKRHFAWLPGITSLPTNQDIQTLMSKTVYDVAPWDYYADTSASFRNYLEGFWNGPNTNPLFAQIGDGLHGRVHIFIGGNMVSNASPNDPVFFLHHANVDRLWAEWQDQQGIYKFPDSWDLLHEDDMTMEIDTHYFFKYDNMFGFQAAFTDMLDVRSNCYRYDSQAATAAHVPNHSNVAPITISPNPANKQVQIWTNNCLPGDYQMLIVNAAGQIQATSSLTLHPEQTRIPITLPALPPGMYCLRLQGAAYDYVARFVKE